MKVAGKAIMLFRISSAAIVASVLLAGAAAKLKPK